MAVAETQRESRHMRALRRYWGNDYDHLKAWETDAPLDERKPKIIIRVEKMAIDRLNNYLFGRQQAPSFSVSGNDGIGINAERARELSSIVSYLHTESGLEELQVEIGRLGMLKGSVAVGFHFDTASRRFDCELLSTSLSSPTFGRDARARAGELGIGYDDLLELDEMWRVDEVNDEGEEVEMIYRRLWTTQATIYYLPLKSEDIESLDSANWVEDNERSVTHNLGFVPVEWIPNGGFVAEDVDGIAVVGSSEFTIADDLNYTLSQTGRGVRYNQEPKTVFVNVSNINEATTLRTGGGKSSIAVSSDPSSSLSPDVKLLELMGTGQSIAIAYAKEIKAYFFMVCQVVEHDPQQMMGALSGTALERLLQPMLNLVEKFRPSYEKRLSRLLSKMLRASGETNTFVPVDAQWGAFITPTVSDGAQAVMAAITAYDSGLIDLDTAIRSIAPYFNVSDPSELAERLRALGTTPDDE